MIKQILAVAIVVALSACSDDTSDSVVDAATSGDTSGTTSDTGDTSGTTSDTGDTSGTTPDSGDTSGTTSDTGGTLNPTGGKAGVWFGENDFGEGVMIIDELENVYALTGSEVDGYETVFGPSSAQMEHYTNRLSDNTATATSFTLVGEPAGDDDPTLITYDFTVENDGQQISNSATGTTGAFTMTYAGVDDVPAINVADIAGTWSAQTSYCDANCELVFTIAISADGNVIGDGASFTQNASDPKINLDSGTVTAANGSSQYLIVNFNWNGTSRSGVLYLDRNDTSRMIINTVGPNGDTNRSITARLTR